MMSQVESPQRDKWSLNQRRTCYSPQIPTVKNYPNGMILGSGLWEVTMSLGTAIMNGVSTLIKEIPESSLTLSALGGQSEKTGVPEPGSRLSPDTESADALIWD